MNIVYLGILIIILFLIVKRKNSNKKKENEIIERFQNKNPKHSSVVIVGCARNIEKQLNKSLDKIEMMSNCFKKSNIIIYENDSDDKTLPKLKTWENNSNLNIKIISENKKNNKNLRRPRTERLSYARNLLLNEARKLNPDYFIVLDLDDVIFELEKNNFLKVFSLNKNWDMIGCNNLGWYRDLWALRCKGWLEGDFWSDKEIVKNHSKIHRIIDPKENLIKVESCFNGLGIYKMKSLKGCKYKGFYENYEKEYSKMQGKQKCEHVNLHLDMLKKNNAQMFIAPFLITFGNSVKGR